MTKKSRVDKFNFKAGHKIADKYTVVEKLGEGFESEVYKVVEDCTKIERAAKLFFPHRNIQNRTAIRYAKLLHQLTACPIVIHYHTHEFISFKDHQIVCLISEYVDGLLLTDFLKRQPGKRLGIFQGLQLLHALAAGLESMHHLKVHHGDLHAENIIVKRYGLGFELKLLDMYRWVGDSRSYTKDDLCEAINVFYQAIGGKRFYATFPPEVKAICCGLKRSLIKQKYKSATVLRTYLENIEWTSAYRE